jgi:hypothetical protein
MDKISSDLNVTLMACMTRGRPVTLGLQTGEIITGYRSHDVIAPMGVEFHTDMSRAVLRGIIWLDHGEEIDRLISLGGIETVREERFVLRYFIDDRFYKRNPIPDGWVRVGSVRVGSWATRDWPG